MELYLAAMRGLNELAHYGGRPLLARSGTTPSFQAMGTGLWRDRPKGNWQLLFIKRPVELKFRPATSARSASCPLTNSPASRDVCPSVLYFTDGTTGDTFPGPIHHLASPAIANGDGKVDAADYVALRKKLGSGSCSAATGADFNGDRIVNSADYQLWRSNYGHPGGRRRLLNSIPEARNTVKLKHPGSRCSLPYSDPVRGHITRQKAMPQFDVSCFVSIRAFSHDGYQRQAKGHRHPAKQVCFALHQSRELFR